MNTGTILRTILAIATSLNTALIATDLTGFNNPTLDTIYTVVSIILNFVIVALVTYFNNDYTETASFYTGAMRQMKAEMKEGYEGEICFDDNEVGENDDDI